jgi:hypothetical protein
VVRRIWIFMLTKSDTWSHCDVATVTRRFMAMALKGDTWPCQYGGCDKEFQGFMAYGIIV